MPGPGSGSQVRKRGYDPTTQILCKVDNSSRRHMRCDAMKCCYYIRKRPLCFNYFQATETSFIFTEKKKKDQNETKGLLENGNGLGGWFLNVKTFQELRWLEMLVGGEGQGKQRQHTVLAPAKCCILQGTPVWPDYFTMVHPPAPLSQTSKTICVSYDVQ